MKQLTIHQPWASLIALGRKTIETRPMSTTYRGPVAIHASKSETHLKLKAPTKREWQSLAFGGGWNVERDPGGLLLRGPIAHPYRLPLGAVVAVADLVDVVPIENLIHESTAPVAEPWGNGAYIVDLEGQRPYGDFTPGRFAWLLDNVRPIRQPITARGFQGLRDCTIADQVMGCVS